MEVNVVALDPDNPAIYETTAGRVTYVPSPEEELRGIIGFGVVFAPVCACCDIPLGLDDRRNIPQMYEDALCGRCFQWVGRTLVKWIGPDSSVAQLPDWQRPRRSLEGLPAQAEDLDEFWISRQS
jgi:hypothetical protein